MNTELVEANVAPNSILYCSLHCLVVYTLLSVKQILSIFKLDVYKIHRKMTRSFGTPTNRPSSLFFSPSNAKNDAGNNKLLPTLHEIGLGRTDG